ncbi:hypothetical protein QBC40DRAFT_285417 [Triangularia verruculosa]|uniref:Zinc finger PHD-type domain-containing protein n=1 Tax=Triangularia verruculosa TaxID=2587418 RepID=A0AAN6XF61_9PEZI|nr:hypothetical protein QBC40DRAFT_285417 [Triangularia verruculosa]
MPATRKRALPEASAENDHAQPPRENSLLSRIRNMWQFANLYQFMMLFGKALKLDDSLDIEDLEAECLKPGSMVLQNIGLGFLKFLSSHRGLTHDLFDEYTRRQFLNKAPEKNPFGSAEAPLRFADFDVFTKVRILQQMTQLIMMSSEKLRDKTEEQKDTDQTNWRIEPYGWDRHDRTYYVLDDNRLYRMSNAPLAPAKPKKNTKKAKAAQRASKRRRVASGAASDTEDAGDEASDAGAPPEPEDDGLGRMKWECLATNLSEVRDFISSLEKTKDPNEKILREQVKDHLLPILEQQEESRRRKQLQREKELLNLEKMAHAKRSSRIAGKLEHRKEEERVREEERRQREEEAARRKEELKQAKMEREREHRLMGRERRLKERELRRLQHEEELAQLSEDSKSTGAASARMSDRRRLAEIERNKKALQELEEEEEDWIFDCICGAYGQIDDGTHSVACERCNVWQHSKCLSIDEEEAEKDDFHFICEPCRRSEQDAEQRRRIRIKVNRQEESPALSSPQPAPLERGRASHDSDSGSRLVVELPLKTTAPNEELPVGGDQSTQQSTQQPAKLTDSQGTNPFSSPRPNLLPPTQLPRGNSAPGPSDGVLPMLPESGNGISPTKEAHRPSSPPTKTVLASIGELGRPASPVLNISNTFRPPQSQDGKSEGWSSPLPPSSISPTKHSPPPPQRRAVNGINGNGTVTPSQSFSNPVASVFPPTAALSPSPRQQILTPPVKNAEPVRAPHLPPAPAALPATPTQFSERIGS